MEQNATLLCWVWGFAEATLFFVVPDVAVSLIALYCPRKVARAAGAAIAGALVGGAVFYVIARLVGTPMRGVVEAVPFIPHRMMGQARRGLSGHGGVAMVTGPLTGIPYKVYVVEAALRSWNLASLLAWTVPARAARIVPAGLIAAGAGQVLRRWIQRFPGVAFAVFSAVWMAIYAVYWRSTGL